MKIENLKRGNQIQAEIRKLTADLEQIDSESKILNVSMSSYDISSKYQIDSIPNEINVAIRAAVSESIADQIDRLEQEFENL